ncbi:DUF423 domain-containing protein [Tenacibaculum tangerinum]|uniref:DUF423 domain-containing protein n=1 Tax=Tenacibaculum tangerinum TaxID=3038772 RepID=A0ABY8KYE3_9FLAO|nr:DUF423 domain-containing protein [Tenacibaculum tangerinum]WGH74257.1 DUF423 domain-containing protein [Tenacibaculum tangerinum]
MTPQIVLITGALFGLFAVVLGAFGAHALKKIATEEQIKSFETGVKYQMYHALVLLFAGSYFETPGLVLYYAFTVGTFLFSFSIYGLVLSSATGKKMKFLGPVTPLGGLLLIVGWISLLLEFL